MHTLTSGWRFIRRLTRQAGPFVLLELLLPGGTLPTLFLLMYRSGALTALQQVPVTRREVPQVQAVLHRPFKVRSSRIDTRFSTCLDPCPA
jgi:hypothetical protein